MVALHLCHRKLLLSIKNRARFQCSSRRPAFEPYLNTTTFACFEVFPPITIQYNGTPTLYLATFNSLAESGKRHYVALAES
jgi:hypothetical protein